MEVNFVRANSGPQISCAPILVGSCSFEKLKNKIKIWELENSLGFGPIPRAYFFGRVFFAGVEIRPNRRSEKSVMRASEKSAI